MAVERKCGITERSVLYALDVIRLFREIENDSVGRILGRQLLRSATSVGANVHEAQGAQSRKDFTAKMFIAHKEARESGFWVRLLLESGFGSSAHFRQVEGETGEINKILASIVLSLKRNPGGAGPR